MKRHPGTNWQAYLPRYEFPQSLRRCFSCFGLILIVGAILVFLILPHLTDYLITASSG